MANKDDGSDLLTDISDMGDDLLPNDGEIFTEEFEDDQQDEIDQEADREKQTMKQSAPILDDLFAWFDNEIDNCDSISTALGLAKEKNISREAALEAFDVVRGLLEEKKQSLVNLKEVHLPRH